MLSGVNLENQWAEIWQLCGRKNEHEATKEEDSRVANRLLQLCWLFPTDCLLSHIIVKNVHDLSHLIIKFTASLLSAVTEAVLYRSVDPAPHIWL